MQKKLTALLWMFWEFSRSGSTWMIDYNSGNSLIKRLSFAWNFRIHCYAIKAEEGVGV